MGVLETEEKSAGCSASINQLKENEITITLIDTFVKSVVLNTQVKDQFVNNFLWLHSGNGDVDGIGKTM